MLRGGEKECCTKPSNEPKGDERIKNDLGEHDQENQCGKQLFALARSRVLVSALAKQ